MKQPEKELLGRLLGWIALAATLIVLPSSAYDPINVPKLAVIAVGGFLAAGALLANYRELLNKKYRLVLYFGLFFVIDLTLVLLIAGTNFYQEFFGTFGRATGYVAYVALILLLLVAVVVSSARSLKNFSWYLLLAGLLSIIYGLVQVFDLDPVNWNAAYSKVFGFLGNPNFQSSFIGFSGVMAFALLLGTGLKLIFRFSLVAYLIAAAFVIKSTDSQQGFLVLLGGIGVVVLIWISRSKFKVLTIPSLIAGFIGVVLVTLGSLNSGPLASILYKASVTYRGDYWRAGWKMTVEHPIFGVGLDSYGDWYRRARTVEATLRRGPDIVSNAAHNVLLDLSSNGGFPLLIIYLFMLALVVVSAIKVLKRTVGFDPVFTGLFAVWIAYQAQSIISLNQLGLAVWGWIISGLIIGYEINTRASEITENNFVKKGKTAKSKVDEKVAPKSVVGLFVGLLVGLLVGIPPLASSTTFLTALKSQNLEIVDKEASRTLSSCTFKVNLASALGNNKNEARALEVLYADGDTYVDCYERWFLISKIPSVSAAQLAEAKVQMKRLDPLNPDLK